MVKYLTFLKPLARREKEERRIDNAMEEVGNNYENSAKENQIIVKLIKIDS